MRLLPSSRAEPAKERAGFKGAGYGEHRAGVPTGGHGPRGDLSAWGNRFGIRLLSVHHLVGQIMFRVSPPTAPVRVHLRSCESHT